MGRAHRRRAHRRTTIVHCLVYSLAYSLAYYVYVVHSLVYYVYVVHSPSCHHLRRRLVKSRLNCISVQLFTRRSPWPCVT